jgi:hypothetical protein
MSIPLDFSFLSQCSAASNVQQPGTAPLDFSFISQGAQESGHPSSNATAVSHQASERAEPRPSQSARRDATACPLTLEVRANHEDSTDPAVSSSSAGGSSSFAQAFSSIKQTKFYEPPPEPKNRTDVSAPPPVRTKPRNPRAVLVR